MEGRRLWEASADFSSHTWRDYIIRKKVKVKLPRALNIPLSRRIGRVEIELHVSVYEGDLSVSRYGPCVPWRTGWAKGTFRNSCWREKSLTLLPSSRQSAIWFGFRFAGEDESWCRSFGYLKMCRNCSKFVRSFFTRCVLLNTELYGFNLPPFLIQCTVWGNMLVKLESPLIWFSYEETVMNGPTFLRIYS